MGWAIRRRLRHLVADDPRLDFLRVLQLHFLERDHVAARALYDQATVAVRRVERAEEPALRFLERGRRLFPFARRQAARDRELLAVHARLLEDGQRDLAEALLFGL